MWLTQEQLQVKHLGLGFPPWKMQTGKGLLDFVRLKGHEQVMPVFSTGLGAGLMLGKQTFVTVVTIILVFSAVITMNF